MGTTGAVRAGAATDIGRVRKTNEDRALTSDAVFAVADGMGGHAAGEVASALVIERLRRLGTRAELSAQELRDALLAANADILADGRRNPERAGMGTTVTGVAVVTAAGSPHWAVFNVGDSRVYRLAAGELVQLTTDHSEVAELVEAGKLTADEAASFSRRGVLTRALGMAPAPEIDLWVFPPMLGERFLICSDGLTSEVPDAGIAAIVRAEGPPGEVAAELVSAAVRSGGRDNVTAVVVDYTPNTGSEVAGDTTPRPAS